MEQSPVGDIPSRFERMEESRKKLKKNIPNSELKIIEGCSHNVHLEKPDEFNKVLKYFLAGVFN